jgi:hypothetical protein
MRYTLLLLLALAGCHDTDGANDMAACLPSTLTPSWVR